MAGAANLTDCIPSLSASGEGNAERDANGKITYLYRADGELLRDDQGNPKFKNIYPNYSPYHGKSQYNMKQVVQHLSFLYELARRRLALNSAFDMNVGNYKADTYHSIRIDKQTERRIIADMGTLYQRMKENYKDSAADVTTTRGMGYMILGVFLHLVQDIQAHRAIVTRKMVFPTESYEVGYDRDAMEVNADQCKICYANILGRDKDEIDITRPQKLSTVIDKYNGIPFIRLKDFLIKNVIVYRYSPYECSAAEGYEDNPYFFRRRYQSAVSISRYYIEDMANEDTKSDTIRDQNTYYASNMVPIYQNSMGTK